MAKVRLGRKAKEDKKINELADKVSEVIKDIQGVSIYIDVDVNNDDIIIRIAGRMYKEKYDVMMKIIEKIIEYPEEVLTMLKWGEYRLNMKEIPNNTPAVRKYGKVVVVGTDKSYMCKLSKEFDKASYVICYKDRIVINSHIGPMLMLVNDEYGTNLTEFVEAYLKNVYKIRSYPPRLLIGNASDADENALLARRNMEAINKKL